MILVAMRCKYAATLPLVDALREVDVLALAPSWMQRVRLPRVRKTVLVEKAILPGLFFISEPDIEVAISLASRQALDFNCKPLTINGQVATVKEAEVKAMGKAGESHQDGELYPKSTGVTITYGVFTGFEGEVIGHTKSHNVVKLKNSTLVFNFPSFMLRKNPIYGVKGAK